MSFKFMQVLRAALLNTLILTTHAQVLDTFAPRAVSATFARGVPHCSSSLLSIIQPKESQLGKKIRNQRHLSKEGWLYCHLNPHFLQDTAISMNLLILLNELARRRFPSPRTQELGNWKFPLHSCKGKRDIKWCQALAELKIERLKESLSSKHAAVSPGPPLSPRPPANPDWHCVRKSTSMLWWLFLCCPVLAVRTGPAKTFCSWFCAAHPVSAKFIYREEKDRWRAHRSLQDGKKKSIKN